MLQKLRGNVNRVAISWRLAICYMCPTSYVPRILELGFSMLNYKIPSFQSPVTFYDIQGFPWPAQTLFSGCKNNSGHDIVMILAENGINPLQLQYVILHTKSQNHCDYCTYIYVHGLCNQNMGLLPASNRHFTVSPHEVFTWFRSAAGSHFIACLPTEEKWSLIGVVRCFWRVLENYDCRTKFNSSLGMEYMLYNGELYGFSAVRVKLVDSLIWGPFILGWIRPRTPMTRRFDTCAIFVFWTICSLNFRTLIDALCNNCY